MTTKETQGTLKTLITAGIVIGIGVFIVATISKPTDEKGAPAPTSTPTAPQEPEYTVTDEKPGWKTYQNKKAGFQVSYPTETFHASFGPQTFTLMDGSNIASFSFEPKQLNVMDAIEQNTPYGDDFLQSFTKGTLESFKPKGTTAMHYSLAGKTGFKFRMANSGVTTDYIFLAKNEKETLVVTYAIPQKQERETYDSVMATLNFLN